MIIKQQNRNPNKSEEFDQEFEEFMENLENMDPEDVQNFFQQAVETAKKEGIEVPFAMELFTSGLICGIAETPVGLAYGVGGKDCLMVIGFLLDEDIEYWGDSETLLEEIVDDFQEDFPIFEIKRNDEEISRIITSALDGTYTVQTDLFGLMKEGSDLQIAVWKELLKIPYGETISYEDLAKRIGKPKAVRAVATAVGQNPLSIAIPCHRVIRKSGDIGEYHWGADIKKKLLAYEQAHKKA